MMNGTRRKTDNTHEAKAAHEPKKMSHLTSAAK